MKKTWLLAALLAAFGTGAANAAGPELITNGSFEGQTITGQFPNFQYLNTPVGTQYANSGVLSSWTVHNASGSRGIILFNSNYQPVANGINALQLETVGDSISQTFHTVVGQEYQLSYALSAYYDPTFAFGAQLSVSAAGQTWLEQVSVADNTAIRNVGYTFTAGSTSTTLSFVSLGTQDRSYPQIDNISVTAITAAVPEPESYAMLMAGLGVVGALARRRRRQA